MKTIKLEEIYNEFLTQKCWTVDIKKQYDEWVIEYYGFNNNYEESIRYKDIYISPATFNKFKKITDNKRECIYEVRDAYYSKDYCKMINRKLRVHINYE